MQQILLLSLLVLSFTSLHSAAVAVHNHVEPASAQKPPLSGVPYMSEHFNIPARVQELTDYENNGKENWNRGHLSNATQVVQFVESFRCFVKMTFHDCITPVKISYNTLKLAEYITNPKEVKAAYAREVSKLKKRYAQWVMQCKNRLMSKALVERESFDAAAFEQYQKQCQVKYQKDWAALRNSRDLIFAFTPVMKVLADFNVLDTPKQEDALVDDILVRLSLH